MFCETPLETGVKDGCLIFAGYLLVPLIFDDKEYFGFIRLGFGVVAIYFGLYSIK